MLTREQKDEDISAVNLPGRDRYNHFVAQAVEETKIGGDIEKAHVFATLALAEATFLAGDSDSDPF